MSSADRTILLVEDNEDDVLAMKWALKKAQIANRVQVAEDGQQAIDYLAGVGCYADRTSYPVPDVVLLDLKLPYRNGMEVLAWIRGLQRFDGMPVIILSGSDEPRDHDQAAALGAREYLVKPPTPEQMMRILDPLELSRSMD